MPDLPRRKHLEVLSEFADPRGRRVLDVGCGDGALLRALLRRGAAEAVGLEPSALQLERARAGAAAEGLQFVAGAGEALDFPDAGFDLVIFFNSLHHLPLAAMQRALLEAARVLSDEGLLYVAEPLAEGPNFELVRPVDDETLVRAAAYEALRAVGEGPALRAETEYRYDAPSRHADFDAFRASLEAVDPARAAVFDAQEESLRRAFERLGRRTDESWEFGQPMRVNLLRPLRTAARAPDRDPGRTPGRTGGSAAA